MKNIMSSLTIFVIVILFYGCGSATCSNCVEDAKVKSLSTCSGFVDRNNTNIENKKDKVYVAYSINNEQKEINLIYYNAAIGCNTSNLDFIQADYFYIKFEPMAYCTCYCVKDVEIIISLRETKKEYEISIEDYAKSESDPKINFKVNVDKNNSGIVSFARTTEPWASIQ